VQRADRRRIRAVAQQQRLRQATDISTISPKDRAPFTFDVSRRATGCGAQFRSDRTPADRLYASVLEIHDILLRFAAPPAIARWGERDIFDRPGVQERYQQGQAVAAVKSPQEKQPS
jgi:hypothetical protein